MMYGVALRRSVFVSLFVLRCFVCVCQRCLCVFVVRCFAVLQMSSIDGCRALMPLWLGCVITGNNLFVQVA